MRLFLLSCGYLLAAFGFAFIVGYAKISLPLRAWLAREGKYQRWNRALEAYQWYDSRFVELRRWLVDLLQCPACLGFWIGVTFALADPWVFGAAVALGINHLPVFGTALFFGLATTASNFILGVITRLIEVH